MYFYNIKLFKSIGNHPRSSHANVNYLCVFKSITNKLHRLLFNTLNYYKKILLFFFTIYKISEKTINFGDKKNNKKDFDNNKKQFNIKDIDTNKILISKPESYDKSNVKNTLLDKTITQLDHYNYFYQK